MTHAGTNWPWTVSLAAVETSPTLAVNSAESSTLTSFKVNECFGPSAEMVTFLSDFGIFLPFLNHSTGWPALESSHSKVTVSPSDVVMSFRGEVKVKGDSIRRTQYASKDYQSIYNHQLSVKFASLVWAGSAHRLNNKMASYHILARIQETHFALMFV